MAILGKRVALCLRLLLAASCLLTATRGEDCAPGVPDCDHVDRGGCGNACCLITMQVRTSAAEVVQNLNSSVATTNGPDGMYSFAPMDSGDIGFVTYEDTINLVKFIRHTQGYPCPLNGTCIYKDTIDILVTPSMTAKPSATLSARRIADNSKDEHSLLSHERGGAPLTDIKFFSISNIGGAYGDGSQNYKNILMLIREMSAGLGLYSEGGSDPPPFTIVNGCGMGMS